MNRRPRKPPPCPKCGSQAVVPIVYGEPVPSTFERAEHGEVVLGGCCIGGDGRDPRWACKSCGARFGKTKPMLGAVEWDALVRTMLPQPVTARDNLLIGGDPGEVVVRVTAEELGVAAFRIEWHGHTPAVVPRSWKRFVLTADPKEVSAAIIGARTRRLASYQWCPECRKVKPPEWMMGGGICQSCGERNHRVVF